jgi:hypothetical protein
MTLEQFLQSGLRDAYVRHRDLRSYVRKSVRLVDGRRVRALDRANTTNRRRSNNVEHAPHERTGQYEEFDTLMRALAVEYGFDGVYVENVLNDFLPAKLLLYGYHMLPGDTITPCFWWEPSTA